MEGIITGITYMTHTHPLYGYHNMCDIRYMLLHKGQKVTLCGYGVDGYERIRCCEKYGWVAEYMIEKVPKNCCEKVIRANNRVIGNPFVEYDPDVLYLCNGENTCNVERGCHCNGGECVYTSDIDCAIGFIKNGEDKYIQAPSLDSLKAYGLSRLNKSIERLDKEIKKLNSSICFDSDGLLERLNDLKESILDVPKVVKNKTLKPPENGKIYIVKLINCISEPVLTLDPIFARYEDGKWFYCDPLNGDPKLSKYMNIEDRFNVSVIRWKEIDTEF